VCFGGGGGVLLLPLGAAQALFVYVRAVRLVFGILLESNAAQRTQILISVCVS
jgi:hypothetical protein